MLFSKDFVYRLYGYGISDDLIESGTTAFNRYVEINLKPKEKYVLDRRYNHNETLQKIGDDLGFSREYIRQIEYRTIYKLTTPRAISEIFCSDLNEKIQQLREEKEKIIKQYMEEIEVLPQELEEEKWKKSLVNKNISELELSVRSNNCLRRAKIYTIGDLAQKTREDLMRIRNLGWRSLNEIVDKMHKLGFKIKTYTHFEDDEDFGDDED